MIFFDARLKWISNTVFIVRVFMCALHVIDYSCMHFFSSSWFFYSDTVSIFHRLYIGSKKLTRVKWKPYLRFILNKSQIWELKIIMDMMNIIFILVWTNWSQIMLWSCTCSFEAVENLLIEGKVKSNFELF